MSELPQIHKIVYLMLENRSLDNVLGWLHRDAVPAKFDGIPDQAVNYDRGTPYSPEGATTILGQALRKPRWDPNEGFANVSEQFYLDGNGRGSEDWATAPPMSGFAYDYQDPAERGLPERERGATGRVQEVMGAYTKEQLPALYGLAERFAVSDRFFCSVPSETDPNRAFAVSGTSEGITGDIHLQRYKARTFFEGLGDKTWGIYWRYNGYLDLDLRVFERVCYTIDKNDSLHAYYEQDQAKPPGERRGRAEHYDEFLRALEKGATEEIPDLCYLEPFWGAGVGKPDGSDFWGLQGTDYHSPAWVGPGEAALSELYRALRSSRYWDNLLLIITFDEHGGTWDHVPPPETVDPDGASPTSADFHFQRLGARVPMILVSPFVEPGSVFRAPEGMPALDHASTIKTILRWAGNEQFAQVMGPRVEQATPFDFVVGDTPHAPAPMNFPVPAWFADQGGGLGPHNLPKDFESLSISTLRHYLPEVARAVGRDPDG